MFENATEQLASNQVEIEEIRESIINMPCAYVLIHNNKKAELCIVNDNTGYEMQAVLIYSTYELAKVALDRFQYPNGVVIKQYIDIQKLCKECINADSIALDALPKDGSITGIVLCNDTIKNLAEGEK